MTGLGAALWGLIRPWRLRLVVLGVAVLAAAVLDLVPPLIVRHVVDALTAGTHTGLAATAALYVGAVAVVQLLTAGYGYLAATIAQRALALLRTRLFGHLMSLPTSYHDRNPVGEAIARATADVETIDDLFSSSIVTLLGETVRLVTVTIAMLVLSPILTITGLIVIPPLVLVTAFMRRRIREAERKTRTAVGATTTQLQEDLSGIDVIRAFGRKTQFAQRFHSTLVRWLTASNTSTGYNSFYAPALAVLSAIATAALLWFGGGGAGHLAGISIGTLTAFVLLFGRFFNPLINLGDEWQGVQSALAGAERVFAVLAIPPQPQPPMIRQRPRDNAPIELQAVGFGYDAGQPVVHGIDLTVAPGEHVALVGRSGAGKSTILALLAGLYIPTDGTILVDGRDPTKIAEDERRQLMGVVPQNVQLFTGTVHDNVTLGDTTISAAQVSAACHISGAAGFIDALPRGYQTSLSDTGRGEGVVLSAGQRQLLALARAIVARPKVLLLDEATAVIDGASDAALRAALRQHVQPAGTAILTVAHRLSTARDADRVVVLSAGRVVEEGTPTQLMARTGVFSALVALENEGWDWES